MCPAARLAGQRALRASGHADHAHHALGREASGLIEADRRQRSNPGEFGQTGRELGQGRGPCANDDTRIAQFADSLSGCRPIGRMPLRFSAVRHPRTYSGYMIVNREAGAKCESRTGPAMDLSAHECRNKGASRG